MGVMRARIIVALAGVATVPVAGCGGPGQPSWCSAAQRQYNVAYRSAPGLPYQPLPGWPKGYGPAPGHGNLLAVPRWRGVPGEPAALLHDALWAGVATWQDIHSSAADFAQQENITRNAANATGAFSRQASRDGCASITIHAPSTG